MAGLAVRLYLGGGSGAPRRYFAWGQAVRRAVLAVMLMHAALGLELLVQVAWSRRLFGLPAPPASLLIAWPGGVWPAAFGVADCAWIAVFVTLALGHYRAARVLAALAIVLNLVVLLQNQLTGIMQAPFESWALWILLDLLPVLALAAFQSGAPLAARLHLAAGPARQLPPACSGRCWRSRRPATSPGCRMSPGCAAYWRRPGLPGARTEGPIQPGRRLRRVVADPDAANRRRRGVPDPLAHPGYLHDSHLLKVSLAELLALAAAAALVAPDAAQAQAATAPPPPTPAPGMTKRVPAPRTQEMPLAAASKRRSEPDALPRSRGNVVSCVGPHRVLIRRDCQASAGAGGSRRRRQHRFVRLRWHGS